MRGRLTNIFLAVVVLALGTYLTFQNLQPVPVQVDNNVDNWKLTTTQLNRSRCEPTPDYLPLKQPQALKIANRVIEFLEQKANETGQKDIRLLRLGLVRLGSESRWWAYEVILYSYQERRKLYRISFLLLLDGKMVVDTSFNTTGIVKALREFESSEDVEIIWSD